MRAAARDARPVNSDPKSPAGHLLAPRYWLAWLAFLVSRLGVWLPYRWQLALGRGVGRAAHALLPRQRHNAAVNIALCFPKLGEREREQLVRSSFSSLGMMLFEIPLAWWGREALFRRLASVEGIEHLHEALARGRGVILLSAHFSTLEISGRLLRVHHPLQVSFRHGRHPFVNWLLRRGRERLYERVLDRDDVRAMVRCLREGAVLWFAPDENFPHRGRVFVPFLGVEAATNPNTARFARLAGAAVVPFAALRLPDAAGYRLVFRPPLEGFPSGEAGADARRVNEALGELIGMAPEQYLWVQKRFLTLPEGERDIYRRSPPRR